MITHVFFNLLNMSGKRNSILTRFSYVLNQFNNTGAQMVDSNYHMTLKLL